MEIAVCKDRKIVEVWLRSGEEDARLRDLCARCRERGYLAAVYRSGTEDLAELTAGLLIHNRRTLAEREPQGTPRY